MKYCLSYDCVKVEYPIKGKNDILKFINHGRIHKVNIVIYSDFESLTKKINNNTEYDINKSYTNQYQKYEPSGFSYYVLCFDDIERSERCKLCEIVHYSKKSDDDDVAQIFVNKLEETVKKIYEKFKNPKKMVYRKEDKENFEKSTHCYVCEGELGNDKVRDHCHFTGRYKGAAHNECNL